LLAPPEFYNKDCLPPLHPSLRFIEDLNTGYILLIQALEELFFVYIAG
jgi:hypothetical protein